MRIQPPRSGRNGAAARRQAFTLLEVTLAISIGVVLMLALYEALSIQFQHARAARELIDETTIVRAIMVKIHNDVSPIQGPVNAFLNASNAYNTNPPTTTSTNSTTNNSSTTTGTTTNSGTSTGTTNSGTTTGSTTANTNPVNVMITNIGVTGSQDSVVFTVSRISQEMLSDSQPNQPVCDIRRITYMVAEEGLVRYEEVNILSTSYVQPVPGSNSIPTPGADAKKDVIGHVSKMSIQYYGIGGFASSSGWHHAAARQHHRCQHHAELLHAARPARPDRVHVHHQDSGVLPGRAGA